MKNSERSVCKEDRKMNFREINYFLGFRSHSIIIKLVFILAILLIIILSINFNNHLSIVGETNATIPNSSKKDAVNTTLSGSDFEEANHIQDSLADETTQSVLYVTIFSINHILGSGISVTPNENSNKLILKITKGKFNDLNYLLYDRSNNLLLSREIDNAINEINMQQFSIGSYVLKVLKQDNIPVQKFVINRKQVNKLQ